MSKTKKNEKVQPELSLQSPQRQKVHTHKKNLHCKSRWHQIVIFDDIEFDSLTRSRLDFTIKHEL